MDAAFAKQLARINCRNFVYSQWIYTRYCERWNKVNRYDILRMSRRIAQRMNKRMEK